MSASLPSRRLLVASGTASAAALTLGGLRPGAAHAGATGAELMNFTTYGGWSEQRPEHGTFGRFDPYLTRVAADGRTIELHVRYDRAEYQMLRRLGVPHLQAVDNAWRSSAWCATYEHRGAGVWEVQMKVPSRPGIGYALMLWPNPGSLWPYGEVNIAEERSGSGRVMTNLHWPDPKTQQHAHDPQHYALDTSKWHTYRVELTPGKLVFTTDGRVVRVLNSSFVPHDVKLHLVLQCGVHTDQLGTTYPADFQFEEKLELRPIRMG